MTRLLVVAALGIATSVTACSPHKVVTNPAPPVALPTNYSVSPSTAPLPQKWWRDFSDPDLNALIERAFKGNFQLRAAWARLRQARATAGGASASRFPFFTGNVSAAKQRQVFAFAPMPIEFTQYELSAGVSYELDLWKRADSQYKATAFNMQANRDDVAAMAMSIAAQIAETWFNLVYQRAQHKLLSEQVKTNETFLELVEFRFKQGLVTALDVFQQRQQLVSTRSQLANVVAQVQQAENTLAILVGQPPRTITVGGRVDLPPLPPLPNTGVPADLLVRRPDVRAARRRLIAADYQVAVAVANRLPGLSLTGQGGLRSPTSITDLFSSPFYLISGALAGPLFDFGRNKAEADRNRGVVEELLNNFGQVLIVAMNEVENALILERQQLKFITELKEQQELAEKTLTEARARYQAGLVDFLRVLTALQNKQLVEVQMLGAARQLLSYRIQLCRALGGTWTRTLEEPKPLQPVDMNDKPQAANAAKSSSKRVSR